jgi:hypothetical protein
VNFSNPVAPRSSLHGSHEIFTLSITAGPMRMRLGDRGPSRLGPLRSSTSSKGLHVRS